MKQGVDGPSGGRRWGACAMARDYAQGVRYMQEQHQHEQGFLDTHL